MPLFREATIEDLKISGRKRTSTVSKPIIEDFLAANVKVVELNLDEVPSTKDDGATPQSVATSLNLYARARDIAVEANYRTAGEDAEGNKIAKVFLQRLDMEDDGTPKDFDMAVYVESKKRERNGGRTEEAEVDEEADTEY